MIRGLHARIPRTTHSRYQAVGFLPAVPANGASQ